jgi:ribosome assembly protein 1
MPYPIAAQSFCILLKREVLDNLVDSIMCLQRQKWLENLSRLEAPCVAFVSRMFVVLVKMLLQRGLHGRVINSQAF